MKKLYILLVTLIAMNEANAQYWTILNSGTDSALSSVCFPAKDTGYICGQGGTILKTIDGGTNWTIFNYQAPAWFYTIHFPDTQTGWTAGQNGVILKTTDGGISWNTTILSPWYYKITSIYFSTANTGYLVAEDTPVGGGVIKKSTNGNYFDPTPIGSSPAWLESVFFWDLNHGWAVGDSGTILNTTDAGVTWTIQSSGTDKHLYSVNFADNLTGYAVGDSGLILFTYNGGINWEKQASGITIKLKSVFCPTAGLTYVVGESGTILGTNDGGEHWALENSGTSKNLNSVYFTDYYTGYAVGDGGLILKTTNGGGVGISESSSAVKTIKIYPNPAHDEIIIETSQLTENTCLSILNVSGQELIQMKPKSNRIQIDIRAIPAGVYLVRLKNDKVIETGKFIKK